MFCREQAAQLRSLRPRLEELGASPAAIGLGDASYARSFRKEAEIDFPLLVDADRQAYRAAELSSMTVLGMLRPTMWKDARRARDEGHRQGKLGESPFQLGG
ncbi:MAG: peroxiredoxin-like family protein, partial [Planctomycetota bacterium]